MKKTGYFIVAAISCAAAGLDATEPCGEPVAAKSIADSGVAGSAESGVAGSVDSGVAGSADSGVAGSVESATGTAVLSAQKVPGDASAADIVGGRDLNKCALGFRLWGIGRGIGDEALSLTGSVLAWIACR